MREIKFMGKRIDNGEWVYGWYSKGVHGYVPKEVTQIHTQKVYANGTMQTNNEVDPKTVGQYTGLKDSYDTEIYEGDILEWFSPKADTDGSDLRCKVTVIWNGCGFDVECYENGLIDFLECKGNETVKVIGNIHD